MGIQTATVVVPTFRRPDGLRRALTAVAEQVDPGVPWDLLVVDNDDPPGAASAFADGTTGFPVPARLTREPRRGASAARNRGLAEATGDIVVFLDDDVVPAADWLRELVAPIVHGRCDGTGGRVVLDPSVPRPRWFDEPGLGPYLAAHDPTPAERPVARGEYVITASAAFRADLLRATGGFDTELGPRDGVQLVNDDVALGDAFVAAGGRLHHVPNAVVVHELPPQRLRPTYLLRRAYSQGRSDWILHSRTAGRREAARRQWGWARHEARARWAGRPWRLPIGFHACTDAARVAGAVREAVVRARHGSATGQGHVS